MSTRTSPCLPGSDRLDAFDAAVPGAERSGATVVADGVMAGGMRFAYVSADGAGVPYVEIEAASVHEWSDEVEVTRWMWWWSDSASLAVAPR